MFTLLFEKEKETKNTVRYAEVESDDQANIVNTIYLQKFAVKKMGNPERITVTIAPE